MLNCCGVPSRTLCATVCDTRRSIPASKSRFSVQMTAVGETQSSVLEITARAYRRKLFTICFVRSTVLLMRGTGGVAVLVLAWQLQNEQCDFTVGGLKQRTRQRVV